MPEWGGLTVFDTVWHWWGGYLLLDLSGEQVERFLNLVVARGIRVWGLRWSENGLNLHISTREFKRLRPLARQTHTSVHIVDKLGFPFQLRRIRGRRMLIAGALVFAAVLYMLSLFIWFVEVEGVEMLRSERIRAEAARYGIERGRLMARARIEDFIYELPMRVKQVAWVSVKVTGTRVTLEVIEQTLPPEVPGDVGPAHVVAAKPGLVEEVLVLAGKALVKKGDMVVAGQPLIAGTERHSEQPPGDERVAPAPIRARGRVKAKVWYDTYAELPLVQTTAERTGAVFSRRMIRLGPEEIILSGSGPVPFEHYEVEQDRLTLPLWRKLRLPVEIITLNYHEVVKSQQRLDRGEVVHQAVKRARQELLPLIPTGASIESTKHELVTDSKRLIGVRVVIQTLENIGIVQPLDKAEPDY
jgi:similar to stage IV sporulation protein